MATPRSAPTIPTEHSVILALLFNACLVLFVINLSSFPAHWWIYDPDGKGIPTDFVNVWAAGRLVLDGHPALAYDWDIQKKVELALLRQDFTGYFAWHYPPPFLFVASFLAQFPYAVAFIGWVSASFVPYLVMVRAIVGRPDSARPPARNRTVTSSLPLRPPCGPYRGSQRRTKERTR